MVAAFIPSRPKDLQHGAWSIQQCTQPEQGTHIIPFKYNICQTPLPNSDPHYPSRDECWSISRWTIHPAHSPDHHRHCDHPLLQMLPTKKQNPTNVSVLYSRLVYDCVSVYVHAYVCTGVYVCVCRGRGGVWCLSNTGSWSFFSCPV